jgi:exodeoxyribonuclease-3
VVEQTAVNRSVAGSNPARGATSIINLKSSVMVKVVSWNVNSVKARLEHLHRFVEENSPDILLLQEIKCLTENFPYLEVEDMGYNVAVQGQKSYNGVAILSRSPIESISTALPYDDDDDQARFIEGVTTINDITMRVASVYVPQGTEVGSERHDYKFNFLKRITQYTQELQRNGEILAFGGDYNVAPEAIDVYDHKYLSNKLGHHPMERQCLRELMASGMHDSYRVIQPHKQEFSWWDYRSGGWKTNKGMRIDQIMLSSQAVDRLKDAGIYAHVRGWNKPSDHAPIYCDLF